MREKEESTLSRHGLQRKHEWKTRRKQPKTQSWTKTEIARKKEKCFTEKQEASERKIDDFGLHKESRDSEGNENRKKGNSFKDRTKVIGSQRKSIEKKWLPYRHDSERKKERKKLL